LVFSSVAGVVIMPAALFLGWTLRPTGGWSAALVYGVVVWLAVVMCATAVTLAVRSADRRVRVVLLAVVAVVLVCGVPSLTFATFAVDYGPAGASCESCAVLGYFQTGPRLGVAANGPQFDRILCTDRRGELRAQAAKTAQDLDAVASWSGWGLIGADSTDETITHHGDTATLVGHVTLSFNVRSTSGRNTFYDVDAGTWTFTLTHTDGWQVCGVDAPPLCGAVLRCVAPAGASPSVSPSASSSDPVGGLLAPLEPMLRCGPEDPFREWHTCPPTASGSPTPAPSSS
jgi:hypothetical protein